MAGLTTPEQASSGWESLRVAEWEQARAAFETELAGAENPEALDGLARARWWLSDIPGAIEAWEDAYRMYRRSASDELAAHVAGSDLARFKSSLASRLVDSRPWAIAAMSEEKPIPSKHIAFRALRFGGRRRIHESPGILVTEL